MKLVELVTVRVTHSYYGEDDRCPDFHIVPTQETEQWLKNHRCVLKSFPDAVKVLIPMVVNKENKDEPLIGFSAGTILTFQLRLHNQEFYLFTDLSDNYKQDAPLYTNKDNKSPLTLALASRTAYQTETLVVSQRDTTERFILSGRPFLDGRPISKPKIEGKSSVSYKDYDESTRILTVDSSKALKDTAFMITYPVKPELERGVFAEVDIYVKPLSSPSEFLIRFEAKKVKWRYYVVTDKKDVKITSTEPALQLNQDPDSFDDIAALLARQYASSKSGLTYLRFTSEKPIACQQQGRDSIALVVDGHKEPLPNPSLHKYAKVKAGEEECLFHVIKYFE